MNLRRILITYIAAGTAVIAILLLGPALGSEKKSRRANQENKKTEWILPAVAEKNSHLSVVLGCPTGQSIVVSILCAQTCDGYIEYGTLQGNRTKRTDTIQMTAGKPVEMILGSLEADTEYVYRLLCSPPGQMEPVRSLEGRFHTQRASGSTFSFAVQGDSHPERPKQNNPDLYAQTLLNAASGHPDFYIIMGDDFSVDTLKTVNLQTVTERYTLQRPFLGLVGCSSPLFLVNGNHEQAARYLLDGTPNNVAVWAQNARNLYYPQPAPDGFYTGDTEQVPHIGLLRDYYAWIWGDALFVVIDPYWHTPVAVDNVFGSRDKKRDLWAITLGDAQYQWFKQTLETSKAKYKFVFAHHVLGTGRGGIENAGLYEWGGKNKKGHWEFDRQRPGWELPIHHLMAKNGVTIFFQGHDHIFARQELDGVIYQTLPDPANPQYTANNQDAFLSGVKWPGSGYLKITVSPDQVRVDTIRSWLPKDESDQRRNGQTAYSYTVPGPSV